MQEDWLRRIHPHPRLVGHERARVRWVEPRRVIYDHELVLFADSEFEVRIDDRSFRCGPGSFLIVPPGRWQSSRNLGGTAGMRRWVHFDWCWRGSRADTPILTYHPARPRWDRLRPAPDFVPRRVLRGSVPSPETVPDLHLRLEERWNAGDRRASARGLLLELLLELLAPGDRASESGDRGARLAHRARLRLEEIAARPVRAQPPVRRALAELGRSYEHVCRLFSRTFGIAPLGYVNALRLERARLLLRETDLNVSEIGRRVGFDNPAYFARLFRRRTGCSPSDFRKRHSGSLPADIAAGRSSCSGSR